MSLRICWVLGLVGLAALMVITVTNPGATRMYAWPWSLVYATALLSPALRLLWRAFSRARPLALPSVEWCAAMLGATAGILASALGSPYRESAVLWSAPLLAGLAMFFAVFDWLHASPTLISTRRAQLLNGVGVFLGAVAVVSMGLWCGQIADATGGNIFAARNPFPLGHSNYTAGLALLMLPCFFALATRVRDARRIVWWFAALLAMAMLLTSGSRGGFLGLAALALFHVRTIARTLRLKLWVVLLSAALVLSAFVYWNPRTRAGFGEELSASNVQRTAMLCAGWRMGADRPLLGWGPGTTPLAYPRYRIALGGGAENVLQLHSTPVQLWAEFGSVNLLVALAIAGLALRAARRSTDAASVLLALSGYAVFSLTDWQLDVPVFTAAIATALAFLAPAAPVQKPKPDSLSAFGDHPALGRWPENYSALRYLLGFTTLLALLAMAVFARRDPAPALNTQALDLARDPARAGEAIASLRKSLALNPDQEIAHFNLGWLLVVSDPPAAERHFLAAARLVPDKGGVYFGLGLAQLNQDRRDAAARAFALECLNDPAFLVSPWWRTAAIGETRANMIAHLLRLESLVRAALPPESPLRGEARYVRELTLWLTTGTPVAHPNTKARSKYFESNPAPPDFENAPPRRYRRERIGYPVLTRNLDLPAPTDLFDVQENALAAGEYGFLFPAKGWLASPLLPSLLVENESRQK